MENKFYGHSKKSGVYRITNKISGKIYIGSAKCFQIRAYQHINSLTKHKHYNKHLQASFDKYGEEVFLFEVIEVVDGDKTARTTKEQEYIDKYKDNWEDCYNITKKTLCKEGPWSKTPEETRMKKSKAMVEKWKEPGYKEEISKKTSIATKAQWKNPDTRKILLEAVQKANKNKIGVSWGSHTEEYKKKISELMKGNSWNAGRKLSKELSEVHREHLKTLINSPKRLKNLRKSLCKPVVAWTIEEPDKKVNFESIGKASEFTNISCYIIRRIIKGISSRSSWRFSFI